MKPDSLTRSLTPGDRKALRARGLSVGEAVRQGRLIRHPPPPVAILRPCSVGDGIERLSPSQRNRLARLGRAAAREGRFSRFIPASGAASRLFTSLLQLDRHRKESGRTVRDILRDGKYPFCAPAVRFFSTLRSLPLFEPLRRCLASRGQDLSALLREGNGAPILDGLFDPLGLDLARLPKALIPFHRAGNETRTAFEEHLVEMEAGGIRRAHFTVPPEFLPEFRRLGARRTRRRGRGGSAIRLDFSVQDPATDTLALDSKNRWVRRAGGALLFRPGGHGALLRNLEAAGGDIVFIKNIDNVPVESRQARGNRWRLVLAGRLAHAQRDAARWIAALTRAAVSEKIIRGAERFVFKTLGIQNKKDSPAERKARLLEILNRPWRVCGMVPNAGEPGGGPFWVNGADGPSRQILEGSQVGENQKKFLRRSTHFNPVDLVVGLKDWQGRSFPLEKFVDPNQALVSVKHFEGREIRTVEHPGLWNGGMARWNTVFVEVPAGIFHPVKTILDLLRPGHR